MPSRGNFGNLQANWYGGRLKFKKTSLVILVSGAKGSYQPGKEPQGNQGRPALAGRHA